MKRNLLYYLSLNYPFQVQKAEDGSWFIIYPDLKGCMSCGNSLEEAISMGEDAKKCWIESALEDGVDIPEPRSLDKFSGNFRLRMPKSLHKSLAEKADQEGISMNQYCIYLLGKELTIEKRQKLKT